MTTSNQANTGQGDAPVCYLKKIRNASSILVQRMSSFPQVKNNFTHNQCLLVYALWMAEFEHILGSQSPVF